jgi:ApbE superfamily uncharacterized protein (UPF0280 family)
MAPDIYEPRTYRDFDESERFCAFRVVVETTDLYVKAGRNLESQTLDLIRQGREQVQWAIARRPEFLTSLIPIDDQAKDSSLVKRMIDAGKRAGTGPMAAVAGAIAEFVGRGLMQFSSEVIVENGGDIFIKVNRPVVVGLFAGNSPLTGRLGIRVQPAPLPVGVCTSSATVGPSLSLGKADAATIISKDVALADALASALGNRVKSERDLKRSVEWAMSRPGVDGAMAILGDKMAVMGDLELAPIRSS